MKIDRNVLRGIALDSHADNRRYAMKKILILVGMMCVNAVMMFLGILVGFRLSFLTWIVSSIPLLAWSIVLYFISEYFNKKLEIKKKLFYPIVCAIPTVGYGIAFIIVIYMDNVLHYWDGQMFGGLGEFILALGGLIAGGMIMVGYLIVGVIVYIRRRKINGV